VRRKSRVSRPFIPDHSDDDQGSSRRFTKKLIALLAPRDIVNLIGRDAGEREPETNSDLCLDVSPIREADVQRGTLEVLSSVDAQEGRQSARSVEDTNRDDATHPHPACLDDDGPTWLAHSPRSWRDEALSATRSRRRAALLSGIAGEKPHRASRLEKTS
jgi:hypothetical protein